MGQKFLPPNQKNPESLSFHSTHILVQVLDRLPDGIGRLVVVRVAEAAAPMTEVGGDDEQVLRIGQVRSEDFAVHLLDVGFQAADEDGNDRELVLKVFHHLCDVR